MKEAEFQNGVFVLSGEIDSKNADEFYGEVLSRYRGAPCDLVFDCAALEFVDSTTLGTFVKLKKDVQKSGHKVVLRNLQPKIKKLFVICKLDAIMELV